MESRGGGGSIFPLVGVLTFGKLFAADFNLFVPSKLICRFLMGDSWIISLSLTVTLNDGRSIFMVDIGLGVKPYFAVEAMPCAFIPFGI